METYEIENSLSEAFATQANALNTQKILKKAICGLTSLKPVKKARLSFKSFFFSTKKGIAAFTASVLFLTALCAGLPAWFISGQNNIVESVTVLNGNNLSALYVEEQGNAQIKLDVKIKYKGEAEKSATSSDVKFVSNSNNAAVDQSGLITITGRGDAVVIVESIKKNAEKKEVRQSINITPIMLNISGVPTTASINTKVILPNVIVMSESEADVFISVKHNGNDVKTAYIDERTGYAIGITDEAVVFDNSKELYFYPTEYGLYQIEYYAADKYGAKSVPIQNMMLCLDRAAPKLIGDDMQIPSQWGLKVFDNANNEISNIISFPYPEYIDNSGGPVRVAFEICDVTNSQTVIKFEDIYSAYGNEYHYDELNALNHGYYMQSCAFTQDGLSFDFTKYAANTLLGIDGTGSYEIRYKAIDEEHNITVKTYSITIDSEFRLM